MGTRFDINMRQKKSDEKDIKDKLDGMAATTQKNKGDVLKKTTDKIAQIAKQYAPEGPTGTLRDSIKTYKRGDDVTVLTASTRDNPYYPGQEYAAAVEFGTPSVSNTHMSPPPLIAESYALPYAFFNRKGTPAQPFMRPTLRKAENVAFDLFGNLWLDNLFKFTE